MGTKRGTKFAPSDALLKARADAARELVAARELEPDLALSFVIWPAEAMIGTAAAEVTSARKRPPVTRAEFEEMQAQR